MPLCKSGQNHRQKELNALRLLGDGKIATESMKKLNQQMQNTNA